jgi:hypothetical protein
MTDTLNSWEKWPVGALVGAAGLNTAIWYVGANLSGPLGFFAQLMITLAAVASVVAIDGALIATIAGMREGRRSRWSFANIAVTALFTGLAALSAHEVLPTIGGALHGLFALTIVTYAMHLSQPRTAATIATTLVASLQAELAEARMVIDSQRKQLDTTAQQPLSLTQVNVNVSTEEVDDRRQRVKSLVDSGVTVSSAAREVGVSRQTATKWLKG